MTAPTMRPLLPRLPSAVLSLLIICLSLFPHPAIPRSSASSGLVSNVDALFRKALEVYLRGSYAEARTEFQALADLRPVHRKSSAATLMLAKSLYKLQEYPLALAAVAQLYEGFPESRYLREGDMVAGDCRFRQGDEASAVDSYGRVLRSEADGRLKARAAGRVGEMVGTRRLTPAQAERLRKDLGSVRFDEISQFGQARWASRAGRDGEASTLAEAFLKGFPDSPFAGAARALVRSLPSRPAGPLAQGYSTSSVPRQRLLKITVICPMSREAGKELGDGASLARELFPPKNVDSLMVAFHDSDDDPVTSVKLVQAAALDPNVVAIIGDLTSRTTVPAAAVANALQTPLVTPTASEDGIASIGACVFQINATPGAQGRKIAESAYERGLRTFAILASVDSYGKHLAEAFAGRVDALGGKIVARQWYSPGTTDFQGQIQRIREVGMAMGGPAATAPDTALSAEAATAPAIDGLLIAAQGPEDVVMTVSQMVASPVAAHLLGGDGWNSPSVGREIGAVSQTILFVSKYFEDPTDDTARRFRESFRSRYGRAPNVASALGYDAMSCVLKGIAEGGITREALRDWLSRGQAFDGATGRVSIPPGERQNTGMYLLTIREGKIVRADQ